MVGLWNVVVRAYGIEAPSTHAAVEQLVAYVKGAASAKHAVRHRIVASVEPLSGAGGWDNAAIDHGGTVQMIEGPSKTP